MRTFHDDRSGNDEVVEPVTEAPTGEEPVYPDRVESGHDTPTADEPVYRDPTQPVEPVYPPLQPHEVEVVTPESENVDNEESFLDKVKGWFAEKDSTDSDH